MCGIAGFILLPECGRAPENAEARRGFVTAMTDPKHPEHQSMCEWHGDAFDPAFVDVVAISLAYTA